MERSSLQIVPGFFTGSRGQIFVLTIMPLESPSASILFLPSLGEEMNRCRTLIFNQARVFAELGFKCQIVDYFGTGDSDGDFREAEWNIWLSDLQALIDREKQSGLPVWLFGCRVGALVALDALMQSSGIEKTVLFQPVVSGRKYVTQMFRQRAAFLLGNEMESESNEQMQARIEDGTGLEIGGYHFGSALLNSLQSKGINTLGGTFSGLSFVWLENAAAGQETLSPASQKAISRLEDLGGSISSSTFCDPPVWQLHERANALDNLAVLRCLVGDQ